MDIRKIDRILQETAYVRTGGSKEERRCAEYLQAQCAELGLAARIEEFEVDAFDLHGAELLADGRPVPCKGYYGCGSAEVEAPLYYLRNEDPYSLQQCRGKVVLCEGHMKYWIYRDLLEHGALGFITYDGNANYADEDIDQRELRSYVHKGDRLPGVNINAKQAIAMIRDGAQTVKLCVSQGEETKANSCNVILDLPGEVDETIVLTAHYDSTSLSTGSYDNMSGSIGLLAMAEHFSKVPHRFGLRFIWCGSEERGLLGAKAYTEAHADELEKIVLNVNLDMIGSIMGQFLACCSAEEKLVHYISSFAAMEGFGIRAYQDVYSSDSTPFADKGVPALSFARIAPNNTAAIHNRYDTPAVMSAVQTERDIAFITAFVAAMANAKCCPVAREIPEAVKEKLDIYNFRKRPKK